MLSLIGYIPGTLGLLLCVYGIIRTILVSNLCKKVIQFDLNYHTKHKKSNLFAMYKCLPPMWIMVFSFRKIRYESWIPKDLIKKRIKNR